MASSISENVAAQANALIQTPAGPQKPPANPQPTPNATTAPQDTVELSPNAQGAQQVHGATKNQLPTTAEIELLQLQGQTVQQIATHFGMSVQSVLSYLGTSSAKAPVGT